MKRRPRIYYSARQRALIWERWRKGETLTRLPDCLPLPLVDPTHCGGDGRDTATRAVVIPIGIDPE